MSESSKSQSTQLKPATDENNSRREFLRKSAYAAYATPVITALLINKASAATSWGTRPPGDINPPPPPPPQG